MTREEEFYCIKEELFCEDSNTSEYEILDDLIFSSKDKAVEYLKDLCKKQGYQLVKEGAFYDGRYHLVLSDESFPEKYLSSLGESYEKYFFVETLTLLG